jgi:dynein heavy chain
MTVSASGIVHFSLNGELTFLTIPEWEREKILFQKLKKIKFFKQYFIWKSFSAWKTKMKRTRIFKTSEFLSNESFILDQELANPLLNIRGTALSIANMDIIKMSSDIARNLSQFTNEQRDHRRILKNELNRSCSDIKDKLEDSCERSMKTFKEVNRISLNEKVEADDEDAEPFLIGDDTQKPMLYAQEATKKTHYLRLIRFVRLVDYIIMDSKLSLIDNSVASALEVVEQDFSNNRKVIIRSKMQSCPLFEIDCSFSEFKYDGYNIVYTPSMYDLRDAIKNAISEGIQLVCTNEQFLHSLEFINKIYNNHDYEDNVSGEFNDLINLAISSETISKNCQNIYDQVENSFKNVAEYSETYQKYIDFHLENLKEDCTQYTDHEQFRNAIDEHERQRTLIIEITSPQDILIYRVNLLKLINEIKPSPEKCLITISDYMPKLSFIRLNSLCIELEEANVLLSRIPSNITEFVDIMKYIWKMDASIDEFTDRFQAVAQLHIVLEVYHIKLPEKNKAKEKDTNSALKSVRQKLASGLEAGEANEIRFKKELDKEVPKFEKRINECKDEIQNPQLYDTETSISKGIEMVDALEKEVETIKNKGKMMNDQQRFLELNEVYFESVDFLYNDFTLVKKLWYGMKKMKQYYEEWLDIPLKDIIVDDIEDKLSEVVRSSQQCIVAMDTSGAAGKFKSEVDLMKNTVPIVSCLRDEALKQRHWDEINNILNGQEIDPESEEFTLRSLIDMNLSEESCQEIAEISLKAKKEAELEEVFLKVKEDWKSVRFDVNPYKDSKDYYVITSTEEVGEVLEESLVALSTILASRFADNIRTEVEQYNKKLSYLEELLDEWMECQKGWTYLESIFHSPDISKSLPSETKKFGQLDQSWKTIMKDVNNSPQCSKIINAIKDDKLEAFKQHNKTLDEIQKALNNYLEQKRQAFSRFFFLSNNELLLILAEANRDPNAVQPHLRKLFENVNRIFFGTGLAQESIIRVESAENEQLVLSKPLRARDSVEKWLKELEES